MKIYGLPMSTCTSKVMIVLAEKGHEAELVPVDLGKGEHKQPHHMERHPFGVIPVLEDDGFSLYESRAIIRYLDQKLDGTPLTPTDLRARARMEQWISVEQSYFSPHVLTIMQQRLLGPMHGLASDEAVVSRARESITHTLDVAGRSLASQQYLAGDLFTLADVCWMPHLHYLWLVKSQDLVENNRHVLAWWKRISQRASWAKVSATANL